MNKLLITFLLFTGFCAQAQPTFKGGLDKFINENIIYPGYSFQNCIQGTIQISFKVNKQGEVYSSAVSSGLGVDLDQEALRLIRLTSGKWKVTADYDTSYVLIAPVNFKLSGAECDRKRPEEMRKAIAVYQANQGLTDAVTNFYRNKLNGGYNAADEPRIIALKKELGYDDAYFESKIKEGQKKLKQNDKQGACEDFMFVKHMGSSLADDLLERYCK